MKESKSKYLINYLSTVKKNYDGGNKIDEKEYTWEIMGHRERDPITKTKRRSKDFIK